MLALFSVHGRKLIVTRHFAKQFIANWPKDKIGPLGLKVKYPHWLFRGIPFNYKVGRGNYKLPWNYLDMVAKNSEEISRLMT